MQRPDFIPGLEGYALSTPVVQASPLLYLTTRTLSCSILQRHKSKMMRNVALTSCNDDIQPSYDRMRNEHDAIHPSCVKHEPLDDSQLMKQK